MITFFWQVTLLGLNKSHNYLSNQILNYFSANQDEFDGKIAEMACTIGSKSLEANTPASPRANQTTTELYHYYSLESCKHVYLASL